MEFSHTLCSPYINPSKSLGLWALRYAFHFTSPETILLSATEARELSTPNSHLVQCRLNTRPLRSIFQEDLCRRCTQFRYRLPEGHLKLWNGIYPSPTRVWCALKSRRVISVIALNSPRKDNFLASNTRACPATKLWG